MPATRSKTRKAQAANPSKPRVSFACETPTRTSTTTPEKKLSPASYLRVLHKRRDALRECALDDSEMTTKTKGKGRADGLGSGDRVSQLRARVRGALQETDPWIELGRALKLQSTLGGKRYIGTSLTTAEPIPLPEPYMDVFPETEEEWDDLRQKTAVVEKVRGWVKSVENSVVVEEEEPPKKRKRQSASASPARKKRREEKEVVVVRGYDPKDPSPLGFPVAKKVPVISVKAKKVPLQEKGLVVLVPNSSPARPPPTSSPVPPLVSSPEDESMESPPPAPPPRISISSVPEDTFFPPSFPSDLVTSTPREDAPPSKPPPVPISAPKPLSSANLRESKMYLDIDLASPTKSLSSIAGEDDDDDLIVDDEEAEHGFDQADDLEGFLERDVSMYGGEDEDESPVYKSNRNEGVEEHDAHEDEETMFGKWFNLPRKSASTSASGGGGWFGRR